MRVRPETAENFVFFCRIFMGGTLLEIFLKQLSIFSLNLQLINFLAARTELAYQPFAGPRRIETVI